MIVNTGDTQKAGEFVLKKGTMSKDERERELRYFHRFIARREISVVCDECHSAKSILDFTALGFNEKETNNLIHLDLKGLVTKYEIFYFPDLFGR